jgi:type VII secretion-associated serine protease mycosin
VILQLCESQPTALRRMSNRTIRSATSFIVLLFSSTLPLPATAVADTIRAQEWIVSALGLAQAHRYTQGNGVVVAVIDTGVDATHKDLRGNVLRGSDFTTGEPTGAGTTDADGHGTGMAGLIAGHGHGNGGNDGILGIAPAAKILPIRLVPHARASGGSPADAISWAVSHGATVISMSFVEGSFESGEASAVAAAYQANVVLVAGVGNVNEGARRVEYPAAYPSVVAVAGTDEHGNHSKVSVTGNLITIAAPSDNIPSTYNNGGYAIGSGTSSSTAIVAGAAALVRSRFPNLTAGEVVNRLTATAIDKGPPGRDDKYGYGLLNLVGALTAKVPPAGSTTSSPSATVSLATPKPPTATINQTGSLTRAQRSMSTTIISIVGVIVVFLALLGAWTLVRRRRPG